MMAGRFLSEISDLFRQNVIAGERRKKKKKKTWFLFYRRRGRNLLNMRNDSFLRIRVSPYMQMCDIQKRLVL